MRSLIFAFPILLVLFWGTENIYAEQTFERGFGTPYEDIGTAVCHTLDSGFVVGGKTKGFSSGINYDFYFVKFNQAGKVEWSNHFGTNYDEEISGIIEISGGELYAVGNLNYNNQRIVLTKLSASGQILWSKVISDTNVISTATELIELPNGNIAISGNVNSGGQSALILIVDSVGNLVSRKLYSFNLNESFSDLIVTLDNNIVACTSTESGSDKKIMVIKMDLLGDSLWSYTSNPISGISMEVNSIVQANSGSYFIGGAIMNFTTYPFFHQIDVNGSFIKHSIFPAISGGVNDLAIHKTSGTLFSADNYSNFNNIFRCQVIDNNLTYTTSFPFFENYRNSSEHVSTVLTPKAIDISGTPVYPFITMVGATRLSAAGDYDIAIIHTDETFRTKCHYNKPQITTLVPGQICPGDSILIILTSPTFDSHRWANFKSPGSMDLGTYSDSIWIKEPGYYYYIGIDSDSSLWLSNEINIERIDTPSTIISTSGSLNFCRASGQSLTLSIPFAIGLSYQWYLNSNLINDSISNSIMIDSSGEYSCSVTNSCNTYTSYSSLVNCESPPISIMDMSQTSGDFYEYLSWCWYINPTHFNITESLGSNYQWLRNGNPIPGQTSSICFIDSSGEYSCVVSNNCGNDTSIAYNVYNRPLPLPASITNQICSSLDSIDLVNDEPFTTLLQWYYNNLPISGGTSNSYYAKQPGNYSYTFTHLGCHNNSIHSDFKIIQSGIVSPVNLGPDTMICYYNSLQLDAGNTNISTYSWNTGETSQTIIASSLIPDTVEYWVRIRSINQCLNYDTLNIIFDICADISENHTLSPKLFPSPVKNTLSLTGLNNEADLLELYNYYGGIIITKKIVGNSDIIDTSELPNGLYFLKIFNSNRITMILKFLKVD